MIRVRDPYQLEEGNLGDVSAERLSVFEDFLGQLDLDKLDDKDKDKPDEGDESEKPDKPGKPDKPNRPKKK